MGWPVTALAFDETTRDRRGQAAPPIGSHRLYRFEGHAPTDFSNERIQRVDAAYLVGFDESRRIEKFFAHRCRFTGGVVVVDEDRRGAYRREDPVPVAGPF